MATLEFFCGPNGSGREQIIDARIRARAPRSILIVPGRAQAQQRREQLLLDGDLPGAWGHLVYAFDDFAAQLLAGDGVRVERIDDLDRRLVLEKCLDRLEEAGRLGPLAEARRHPGVVSHILHILAKLKQAAIEPPAFRECLANAAGPFDTAVAEIYQAYQETLIQEVRHDVPGLYWEAEVLCRKTCPRVLAGLEMLGFDGFDDFTPSEFRLLKALYVHAGQMAIGLNYDQAPGRSDLYVLPRETADRIWQAFDTPPIYVEPCPVTRYSQFAARNLFWRDQPVLPDGLEPDLEIVPCSDLLHELETIGRRVKSLILDGGLPPETIAVVFRNFGGVASLLRIVFAEFGIPIRIRYRPPLEQSMYGTLLTQFFGAIQTWDRDEVLEVLLSPPLAIDGVSDAFPLLSRRAGVVRGRAQWKGRIERLIERIENGRGEEIEDLTERLPDAAARGRVLLDQIEQLGAWADRWPKQASQADFAQSLDLLLESWNTCRARHHVPLDPPSKGEWVPDPPLKGDQGGRFILAEDSAALGALRGLLGRLGATQTSPRCIERSVFLERLSEGLRATVVALPDSGTGVFCADAPAVRQLKFRHVFFGGLIEGEMPVPPAINAIYPEKDLGRLRGCGIDLEGVREHIARERLLFHHAIESAQEGLTLTWRLNKSGGRPATSSPLLTELKSVFPDSVRIELPEPEAQSFLPKAEQTASFRDARNILFHAACEDRKRFPAAFLGETVEIARAGAPPYDVFSGVLCDTAEAEAIAVRYGAEHEFSVAQIETYLGCPFRFLAERLWRLDGDETPEAEFDPRVRGVVLHAALRAFHAQYVGRAVPEINPEEADARMRDCVQASFSQHAWKSISAPPALADAEQARMTRVLLRYLAIERGRNEIEWKPMLFEIPFGHPGGKSGTDTSERVPEGAVSVPDSPATEAFCDALEVDTPEGPIRFGGRIDRIDRNENAARILDYKSGALPAAKDILDGRSIQLSVYAWAVEHAILTQCACEEAYFLAVGREKRQEALRPGRNKDKESREARARQAIGDAVRGIRAGHFPPEPAAQVCTYCGLSAVCRKRKSQGDNEEDATAQDSCAPSGKLREQ